jgi:hypothetical protein
MSLPPLPPFPGKLDRDTPASAEMRHRVCDVCGQRFDTEDQDQVFHHGPEPHEPLEAEPKNP